MAKQNDAIDEDTDLSPDNPYGQSRVFVDVSPELLEHVAKSNAGRNPKVHPKVRNASPEIRKVADGIAQQMVEERKILPRPASSDDVLFTSSEKFRKCMKKYGRWRGWCASTWLTCFSIFVPL